MEWSRLKYKLFIQTSKIQGNQAEVELTYESFTDLNNLKTNAD